MSAEITVIDYGVGNLFSVERALEHCGANVVVTSDHERILAAEKLLLPGVGAFADAMKELDRLGLVSVIRSYAEMDKPLLGICLGMQLLLDESEEFGLSQGLGLISGRVVPVPPCAIDGTPQKVPHIGWNGLLPVDGSVWTETILSGVKAGQSVYFVHSFMASVKHAEDRLADCNYGGHLVPAVIASGNVVGCQFHPEKSGDVGLNILRAFCDQ